jgi:hypothetical protein
MNSPLSEEKGSQRRDGFCKRGYPIRSYDVNVVGLYFYLSMLKTMRWRL